MKSAMKEMLVVQTTFGDDKKLQIWNGGAPVAIGHPFRWVLEKTKDGVRVRDLRNGSVVGVSSAEIQSGAKIKLRDPNDRRQKKISEIFLKPANPTPPVYLSSSVAAQDFEKGELPLLFGYSGMRRSLVNCDAVHSAYVAYERNEPVFALYHQKDGVKIKTLASGVRLKMKGATPTTGDAGTIWELKNSEVQHMTLFRGWYWWRFSWVKPSALADMPATLKPEDDEAIFKKFAQGLLALFLAISAAVLWSGPSHRDDFDLDQGAIIKLGDPATKMFLKHPSLTTVKPPSAEDLAKNLPPKEAPKPSAGKPAETIAEGRSGGARPGVQNALSAAKSLKQALKGLSLAGPQGFVTPQGKASAMFDANSHSSAASLSMHTEVKPILAAGNTQVAGIGGSGGETGDHGTGYGKGNSIKTGGGRGGFVSLGEDGYKADEGLTKDEVGAVIYSHMGEVRYCHESAILQDPKTAGRLMIQFKIDPHGRVEVANIDSSTLPEGPLAECVRSRLMTWMFPKPRGGSHVNVTYPFVFRLLERE